LIAGRGYTNRSEAFRDMIREELVNSPGSRRTARWWDGHLVYDHHARLLGEKLTGIQHEYHRSVLSTLHVHLDHDLCWK